MSKWGAHNVTASRRDLQIANNVTWSDAFQFGTPTGQTWTLEDQSFELDVQRNPYDEVPLLSLSTTNGRIIVDDIVQRVIHFNVPADEIQANLTPGKYVYDLVMVDSLNKRTPLMYGTVDVAQGVTYPE